MLVVAYRIISLMCLQIFWYIIRWINQVQIISKVEFQKFDLGYILHD